MAVVSSGVVSHAALKANMHPETAARYLKANAGPADQKQQRGPRTYRTRSDPLRVIRPEAAYQRRSENHAKWAA
jgi:hypothetical protein